MIWIVTPERSYSIEEVNVNLRGDKSELWVKRTNGNTTKIVVADEETVAMHKEAIDFAVKGGYKTYELK